MGILKIASDDTVRLDLGEGDFLEVRSGVSKKDFRKLLDKLPSSWGGEDVSFTPGQMDDFSTALFIMLVKGWSLEVEASEENYLSLERAAAAAVDVALMEHFNGLTPSQEERSKSKGSSK